jgi:hypothetical protein
MDLLAEHFIPMDIEAICSISLNTQHLEDLWAWHYEKSGVLSARSVYRLLVDMKKRKEDWLDERSAGSNTARYGKLWKKLWKVQIPPKLRMFLWRLALYSMPTRDVCCHRHMADTPACSISSEVDSWRHSLLNYTVAKCVWALANDEVIEHMSRTEDPSAKQWLFSMLESLSLDDFATMVVTLWAIWFARRKIISEGEFQSPLSTHMFA